MVAFIYFLVLGVIIFGVILKGVIQYSIKAAGAFDIFFVNNLGFHFFTGFAFFLYVDSSCNMVGIAFSTRKQFTHLQLSIMVY